MIPVTVSRKELDMADDTQIETLVETKNYVAWHSTEPDGEKVIHLELGPVTLHFFPEEWPEVVTLVTSADTNLKSLSEKK